MIINGSRSLHDSGNLVGESLLPLDKYRTK
jgi:hypothetical protein